MQEVESALTATKAAKANVDKAHKQSAANVSQLTQDLADANSGKSAAESQWQKLSQDIAKAQTENKQLDTHNAELDRKLTEAVASHDSSEQALQQAREECSSLSEQLTAANSGKSDVDDRLHDVSERLKTAMGDYNAVKTQCSDLTQERSDLTQERSDLTQELQLVKTHKSTAEDALSETKGNLQQVTQQLQTNQSAFQELKSLKADLRRELIATTSQKADLEQDLKQHKSELDRVTDELKTAQKTSSRELWAARDDLAKSKRELADAQEDFDRIQVQYILFVAIISVHLLLTSYVVRLPLSRMTLFLD